MNRLISGMNTSRAFATLGLAMVTLCAASTIQAQTTPAPAATPAHEQKATVEMNDAEVRKVDIDSGKITLKHGEIKSLDMPPMTMVFNVKDKALLTNVKAGDKIKFAVISENRKYVITQIEAAK